MPLVIAMMPVTKRTKTCAAFSLSPPLFSRMAVAFLAFVRLANVLSHQSNSCGGAILINC
jgi:hypothetical protein